jgi:hypothetical protein
MSDPTPIPGFEDYGATRDGQIWSHKSGAWKARKLTSKNGPDGYLKLNISGKTERVADLVARTFIGPRPASQFGERVEINHKDLNKQNNADWNLEYLTQLENVDHALKARGLPGVKTAERHLTEMLAALRTVLRREHRRVRIPRGHRRGEQMTNRRLSNEDVLDMRALHGVLSLAAIGRQFGVSKQTVWRVVHGLKWGHLLGRDYEFDVYVSEGELVEVGAS